MGLTGFFWVLLGLPGFCRGIELRGPSLAPGVLTKLRQSALALAATGHHVR